MHDNDDDKKNMCESALHDIILKLFRINLMPCCWTYSFNSLSVSSGKMIIFSKKIYWKQFKVQYLGAKFRLHFNKRRKAESEHAEMRDAVLGENSIDLHLDAMFH